MSKTSSNNNYGDRRQVLQSLIAGKRPIAELRNLLKQFDFDCEPLVTLRTDNIIEKLTQLLNGELDADYIQQWADLIEVRDDICFDPADEDRIKQAIYEMANPELMGLLNVEMACKLRSSLSDNAGAH